MNIKRLSSREISRLAHARIRVREPYHNLRPKLSNSVLYLHFVRSCSEINFPNIWLRSKTSDYALVHHFHSTLTTKSTTFLIQTPVHNQINKWRYRWNNDNLWRHRIRFVDGISDLCRRSDVKVAVCYEITEVISRALLEFTNLMRSGLLSLIDRVFEIINIGHNTHYSNYSY